MRKLVSPDARPQSARCTSCNLTARLIIHRGHTAYPVSSQRQRNGLSRDEASEAVPLVKSARVAAEPGRRREWHEMVHLHATHRSPLVRAAHPVRLPAAALQSRWPAPSR